MEIKWKKLGRRRWLGTLALGGVFCFAPAWADVLNIYVQPSVTYANPGGSGSFDILLTDENGGTGVKIAGFEFGLKSTSPDVTFVNANTSLAEYIFRGNSFVHSNSLDLALQTSPELIALDATEVPGSFVTLMGGQTVDLGKVLFDVSPTAPTEMVGINVDAFNTNLSDQNAEGVAISSLTGGTIKIPIPTAVPEPSPFLMLLSVPLLFLRIRLQKSGAYRV